MVTSLSGKGETCLIIIINHRVTNSHELKQSLYHIEENQKDTPQGFLRVDLMLKK